MIASANSGRIMFVVTFFFRHQTRTFDFSRWNHRVPPRSARIWFHFVERLAGNHIDEWLLIRERHQEGTL
jgi:hypothetical protein